MRHRRNRVEFRGWIESRRHILESRPDRDCILRQQQRVAVRCGGRDVPPGDIAARAGDVFDIDRLPEFLAERARQQPRERIGGATRREADNQPDRPVWIVGRRLCMRNDRTGQNDNGVKN
jgi:hypothetical protein